MRSHLARCFAALLCAALLTPVASAAQARLDVLQALLATERALAGEAIQRYLDERAQQTEADLLAASAIEALDSVLVAETETPPLAELERLHIELEAAVVAAEYSAGQARQARQSLFEHWRRIDALERQIRGILGGGDASDPITGRWRVKIASPPTTALFELQLTGTLVSGTFLLENERGEAAAAGSLRGTYAGGQLRLERVDTAGGVAGTYLGSVDAASGRASGLWSPRELSDGGPGITGWSAERSLPEDDEGAEESGSRGAAVSNRQEEAAHGTR